MGSQTEYKIYNFNIICNYQQYSTGSLLLLPMLYPAKLAD
jgi:hypothetical protein